MQAHSCHTLLLGRSSLPKYPLVESISSDKLARVHARVCVVWALSLLLFLSVLFLLASSTGYARWINAN